MEKAKTVEEYIALQPETHQEKLREMWLFLSESMPFATEEISYNMPMYKHFGMLAGFGYIKSGISFYACSTNILAALKADFEGYQINVSALHIRLNQNIPQTGILKVIDFRKAQNEEKEAERKAKKQKK